LEFNPNAPSEMKFLGAAIVMAMNHFTPAAPVEIFDSEYPLRVRAFELICKLGWLSRFDCRAASLPKSLVPKINIAAPTATFVVGLLSILPKESGEGRRYGLVELEGRWESQMRLNIAGDNAIHSYRG
jgi:hypothetical protein